MWNDKRIVKAVVKNLITSALLLLALFIADNRSYLFHYLPHRFEYEQREAYIQSGTLRHNYMRVIVMEQDRTVTKAAVKHTLGETAGTVITVGYSSARTPSVVRISPIITGGQIGVFIALILGNLGFVRRLYKARKREVS